VQYRHAYQQLTGVVLPPAQPLPPPPEGVGPGGDVEELLAQVDRLTGTRPLVAASLTPG
jgi:hypothetical protein